MSFAGRDLLNIQYSVFFGLAISTLFLVTADGVESVLNPGRPESCMLILYFVLDWFTVNVYETDEFESPWHLFLRILWVAFLGIIVIAANSHQNWKFNLFAPYFTIAAFYDFYFNSRLLARNAGRSIAARTLGILTAVVRLVLAFALFLPMIIGVWLGRDDVLLVWDNPASWWDALAFVLFLLIISKAGRFTFLIRYKQLPGRPLP